MNRTNQIVSVVVILLATFSCFAQGSDVDAIKTVEQSYPELASGVLTHAKVLSLPKGILFKFEDIEISLDEINESILLQPDQLQPELKKNVFFVLEQRATEKVLKKIATQKISENKTEMSDSQVTQAFFEDLTKDVKVTDQDIETFYKENESVFCGTPLENVRKQIKSYVLQDKKQRFIDMYIQTLGQNYSIAVSADWAKQQAAIAKDNPLDKARAAGKPTLAIFSAASCCGPDKMIPVKKALQKKYDSKITIVYIEPKKEQILSARYGIRSIPSQIIYDKTGKEYFRHSGFYSEKDIIGKFSEMGVD